MLTLEQMRVLKTLNEMQESGEAFSETTFYNQLKRYDNDRIIKLCEQLATDKYVEKIQLTITGRLEHIELKYPGMVYRRLFVKDCIKAVLVWLANNLVGIAALLVSIIALLRTVQGV